MGVSGPSLLIESTDSMITASRVNNCTPLKIAAVQQMNHITTVKPQHMHKGYGSHCACLSVCLCVWYRASGYIPGLCVLNEVAAVSRRILKICIVWTSLKTFHSGDMVLFACHYDRRLCSFSTKKTPMVLDTITNDIVCEPLDNYLNFLWVLGFIAFADSSII